MTPMDMRPRDIQQLALLPKIMLSMHVLALNVMDLRQFLQAELEQNPILEEDEAPAAEDETERIIDDEISRMVDDDLPLVEGMYNSDEGVSSADRRKQSYRESLIVERESLYGHLHWQLEVLAEDEEQKRIGECLIGSLDDNGYLDVELEQLPGMLGTTMRRLRNALSLVRTLDPAGVAARSLKECLLLQLISMGKGDSNLYRIISFYLDDLERGNHEKIARQLKLPVSAVEDARRRISYLNPKPGASFSVDTAVRVLPDAFAWKDNGGFSVDVNKRDLPGLSLSRQYTAMLKNRQTPRDARMYIKEKYSQARWLIDSLKQRDRTLGRVCAYLVQYQAGFLKKGGEALLPLNLKQVAAELGMSQATASRAVSNKYLETENSILPLRSFFAGSVEAKNRVVSSTGAKAMIEEMVAGESPESPLRDGQIRDRLCNKGIRVSRRTVAKYRTKARIPPWNERKSSTRGTGGVHG